MENTFGEFLKMKRQEKQLTQKDLAKELFVSESAVSKWEKDVSRPDIALLPKLSSLLGVSEHELITASIDRQSRKEKIEAKKWRRLSFSWHLFFYLAYGITILTCFICNLAVNKTLGWFWIVVSALLLAFTFTSLPKYIKKHRLLLIPLSMYLALCFLLAVCAVYTKGEWLWIPVFAVLLGLFIVFLPIYIAKYKVFARVKKYNDFLSVAVDFLVLQLLLIIINRYAGGAWYFKLALPISLAVYAIVNLLLSVRFLRINKLLKTSLIVFLIDMLLVIPPLFIKVKNPQVQKEIEDFNIFKADFSVWKSAITLENNISCIIALTLLALSIAFLISGLLVRSKPKND